VTQTAEFSQNRETSDPCISFAICGIAKASQKAFLDWTFQRLVLFSSTLPTMSFRILLIEDDELFRLGLRVRLQQEPDLEVMAEA
jgi:hypothetical protein